MDEPAKDLARRAVSTTLANRGPEVRKSDGLREIAPKPELLIFQHDSGICQSRARRLAADVGPAWPALVERELHTPKAGPQRSLGVETAIATAGLLINVAPFVWPVYRDLTGDRPVLEASDGS